MDGEHVGAREQLVLGDERRAGGLGALGGEILAPGQDLHAEGAPDRRHARPEPAEPEDRERPAVQRRADGLLPAALAHALVLLRDVPHQRQDQPPGELRRRVLRIAAAGVRDRDAALLRGRKVEGAVVRPGHDDELQGRQALDQRARHRHALAQEADDVEVGKRACRLILGRKVAVEDDELAIGRKRAPVGHRHGDALVVVEDRDACHGVAPGMVKRLWRGRRGRSGVARRTRSRRSRRGA